MELNYRRNAREAWQQAWRLRCCPPEQLLTTPPDVRLQEHLALCPWCRASMDLPPCPLPVPLAANAPSPIAPLPGQVYAIHSRLAGWGPKGRYYNPPLVLILSLPDERSVFVSQIYGDEDLAGHDDVPLGNALRGFAQPWNCYTLMRDDLGMRLGEVDAGITETVLQRADWVESPVQPGSLLWFFRQMEVETGFFFAQLATERLLTIYEHSVCALLRYEKNEGLVQDLLRLPITLAAGFGGIGLDDLLAGTCADDRLLPLAAADGDVAQALVFTMDRGRIVAARNETLLLSFQERAGNILTVTGSAVSIPEEALTWIFRWRTGNELIPPLPGQSGREGPVFWAAFSLTPEQIVQPGTLVVRVLAVRQE